MTPPAVLGARVLCDLCESATYADLAPLPDGALACPECRARDADPHVGHELVGLNGRRHPGRAMVGYLVCLDCAAIVRPLRACGRPTKRGTACCVPVREDLGNAECWSHGEGRGRTSTPRRIGRTV